MKEGLDPNQHRIYEGRTRCLTNTGFIKEGLDPNQYTGFMKEGLEPNQHRIYEGRTRS